MACYSKWSTPVHQLPKSPEIVEERLRDIAENKDNLEKKMRECIGKSCSLKYVWEGEMKQSAAVGIPVLI